MVSDRRPKLRVCSYPGQPRTTICPRDGLQGASYVEPRHDLTAVALVGNLQLSAYRRGLNNCQCQGPIFLISWSHTPNTAFISEYTSSIDIISVLLLEKVTHLGRKQFRSCPLKSNCNPQQAQLLEVSKLGHAHAGLKLACVWPSPIPPDPQYCQQRWQAGSLLWILPCSHETRCVAKRILL